MGTDFSYSFPYQLLQNRRKIFKILKGLEKNISILDKGFIRFT